MNSYTWVIVALCAGHVLLWWALDRYRRWEHANLQAAFMEGTRLLAEECATLKLEVERAREIAQDERSKRERYFTQLEAFEKQRVEWQELYFAQSVGHGNAQSLMMQTIERLSRELQAKGGRPVIPKVLHALRGEFEERHELPARQAQALLKENAAAAAALQAPPGPPSMLAEASTVEPESP